MTQETWVEGRSPLIQVNNLADELARRHLLHAQFTDLIGTTRFPGEGPVGHYHIDFSLESGKEGIQLIKIRRRNQGDLQPGFYILVQRISVRDGKTDLFANVLSPSEITIDLTTGAMLLQQKFARIDDPHKIVKELKTMVEELRAPTTQLVSGGFSDLTTGLYHRLIPPSLAS